MKSYESILLVDDDEVSNFLTSKIISKSGLADNIEIKLNGFEATDFLDACKEGNFPDLVFLDINMPLMNGFEVLEYCQKKGYSGKTRFVILSTSTHQKDKITSMKFGDVIGYIEKPLSVKKIEELLPEL